MSPHPPPYPVILQQKRLHRLTVKSLPLLGSLLLLAALWLPGPPARAQFYGTSDAKQPVNKVFLEAFGTGGAYSLNYERTVAGGLNGRIGTSLLPSFPSEYTTQVIVPVAVSYLVGTDGHHLEVGASATAQVYGRRREREGISVLERGDREFMGMEYAPGLLLGYRYQAPEGGLVYRLTYTPLHLKTGGWTWLLGVSVGYGF